jgi:hypothetical protein
MAQVIEHFLCIYEALSSNPHSTKINYLIMFELNQQIQCIFQHIQYQNYLRDNSHSFILLVVCSLWCILCLQPVLIHTSLILSAN